VVKILTDFLQKVEQYFLIVFNVLVKLCSKRNYNRFFQRDNKKIFPVRNIRIRAVQALVRIHIYLG
jgi:ribosomal protein S3AE